MSTYYTIELREYDTREIVATVRIAEGKALPEGLGIFGRLYDLPLQVKVFVHRPVSEAVNNNNNNNLPAAEEVTETWLDNYHGFRELLAPIEKGSGY